MGQVRWIRVGFLLVAVAVLASGFSSAGRTAYLQPDRESVRVVGTSQSLPALVAEYHGFAPDAARPAATHPNNSGGIREQIPKKYSARYRHWKDEFLATITGREQWAFYQNNPNFTLTVVISRENPEGGNTSNYEWNEDGKLVAATITLGSRIDEGVPNPVYFPVMNSLLPTAATTRNTSGETLAATKIAHEFGHVNRTAKTDPVLYQLQLKLMPQYNQILLNNGRDISDPRLVELARRMGATPVEIWEDREYWGETNAMLYLRDRFADKGFRCVLFNRIKRSVDLYAPSYEERFLNIAESIPPPRCGW